MRVRVRVKGEGEGEGEALRVKVRVRVRVRASCGAMGDRGGPEASSPTHVPPCPAIGMYMYVDMDMPPCPAIGMYMDVDMDMPPCPAIGMYMDVDMDIGMRRHMCHRAPSQACMSYVHLHAHIPPCSVAGKRSDPQGQGFVNGWLAD